MDKYGTYIEYELTWKEEEKSKYKILISEIY